MLLMGLSTNSFRMLPRLVLSLSSSKRPQTDLHIYTLPPLNAQEIIRPLGGHGSREEAQVTLFQKKAKQRILSRKRWLN